VQAVGGGMAGSAVGTDPQQVKTGSKWVVSCAPDRPSGGKLTATFSIMLAGIVSQLVVMLFYVAYTAVWVFRAREKVKLAGSRFQWMLVGMLAASIGIVVRGVSPPQGSSTWGFAHALTLPTNRDQCYRTPELAEGFSGWIATQQIWMLFDAVPVAFSSFVLKWVVCLPARSFLLTVFDTCFLCSPYSIIHPHWFLVYSPAIVAELSTSSEKPRDDPTAATDSPSEHDEGMQPPRRSDSQETAVAMVGEAKPINSDARFDATDGAAKQV
jgi:hypothetical protein